jgi:hypothetical protein
MRGIVGSDGDLFIGVPLPFQNKGVEILALEIRAYSVEFVHVVGPLRDIARR